MTDNRKEMLSALSNDTEKMKRLRDECLSAFFAAISANESAAIVVRKLTGG